MVDVGAVEQAITQVIDTAVIAEDTQDYFLEVKKVIAQAIVEAATVAGTQGGYQYDGDSGCSICSCR